MTALERITTKLRTILAPHIAFQLVDWRSLWTTNNVQRHGLMSVAAETFDFKIEISGVKRVAERRRRLGRTSVGEHS
jgi:hypothetical protein